MYSEIYLASQSPRRAELLEQLGVGYERLLPQDSAAAEELEKPLANEDPTEYVRRVTALKMQWAQETVRSSVKLDTSRPILCADTTVSIDRDILGKPKNAKEARAVIKRLNGSVHRVITALALASSAKERASDIQLEHAVTTVTFAQLSDAEIDWYMASEEWRGKAGSYGIQGKAAAFIQRIEGNYSTVVGLPLPLLHGMLKKTSACVL